MAFKKDLLDRLQAASGIAVIAAARLSWFERPRGQGQASEFPALVLQMIDPGRNWSLDGPTGLDRARVQVDLYGQDAAVLETLTYAVRDAFEARPYTDQGSTRFHPGFLALHRDFDPEDIADGKKVLRHMMHFEFYHEGLG